MKKISTLLMITTLMLSSCKAQKKSVIQEQNTRVLMEKLNNRTIESILHLKKDNTIFNKNYDINFTFKEVIQDTRCPINAKCEKAGEAIVEIELMSIHSRPQRFLLSTDKKSEQTPNMIVFNGYEMYLEALLPHPRIAKRKSKISPSIKLRVKKHALQSPLEQNTISIEELKRMSKKGSLKRNNNTKGKAKLLENYNPATSKFRIHPAEAKTD